MLDIEKISRNAEIRIGMPHGVVTAFMTGPLHYNGSATYGNAADQLAEAGGGLLGRFNPKLLEDFTKSKKLIGEGLSVISQVLQRGGMTSMPIRTAPIQSTYKTWQKSNDFTFSLEMTFLAFEAGMNVKEPVQQLTRCTYPNFDAATMGLIFAPNDYNIGHDKCVSVRVGKYFYIPRIMLISSTTFQFSKEVMPDGNPLYATGQVGFECYRALDAEEVMGFLIDPTVDNVLSETETKKWKDSVNGVGSAA